MNILVKFPSRGRPKQLIKTLSRCIALANDNSKISYLLTLDIDDHATNNNAFNEVLIMLKANIQVIRGRSSGKIHACNRDITQVVKPWDIVVLMSDDMTCQVKGWDDILRQEMSKFFPDTDGVLFHNDGFCEEKLNTLCILGKKYFDRFGYIYNPNYKSLWSDNEFMEVATYLNKQRYFAQVLFKHEHPANIGGVADSLYVANDKLYLEDKATYNSRKLTNFGL